jgi:hypothetical protein
LFQQQSKHTIVIHYKRVQIVEVQEDVKYVMVEDKIGAVVAVEQEAKKLEMDIMLMEKPQNI